MFNTVYSLTNDALQQFRLGIPKENKFRTVDTNRHKGLSVQSAHNKWAFIVMFVKHSVGPVSFIYLTCSHCLCAAEDKHCSSQDCTSISLSVAYSVELEHERRFHLEFQKVKVFQLSKSHQSNQQRSAL